MNEQRRLQIHSYLEAFFSTIRKFLEKEPQYIEFVPELFKFTYLFLIHECDDGYLVAAYPSGFTDNYINIDKHGSVIEAMKKLPNLIAGTTNHVVLRMSDWGGSGSLQFILDFVRTDRGPLPTTGWKFLILATKDWLWPIEDAIKSAQSHVGEFKARAAVYEPGQGILLKSYNSTLERQEITGRLHDILKQYQAIVSEESYREKVVHRYLRDHPVMFFPTKKRMLYEYPLKENGKAKYVIDFVVELTTGRYILVELENPNHTIFTVKGAFTQAVNHAENQISDWMLWLRQHPTATEKDLPGIMAPEGMIVIGRSTELTKERHDKIRMRNEKHTIKLMTYDDLAEEAENHIRHVLEA